MRSIQFRSLLVVLFMAVSFAAYAVDWFQQDGSYFKYDTTPTKVTGKTYKYLATTNVEVPVTWVKQPGTYTLYKSAAGANQYRIDVVIVDATPCKGAFKCRDATGVYYDMTQNFVLQCPAVKLVKDDYLDFEGAISVNNEVVCPK